MDHLRARSLARAFVRCSLSALALALLAAGCHMTSPLNGQHIDSTTQTVAFTGYLLAPGAPVELRVGLTPNGPFTAFATTTSQSTPTTVGGTDFYAFSTQVAIPSWHALPCGHDTFVRARSNLQGLLTMDYNAANSSGGQSCIQLLVARGTSIQSAAVECQSSESPVVRVFAGPSVYQGDVVVSTQAEADAYVCYAVIDGSLTIADNQAALSIAMPHLTSVTGDLHIVYSRHPDNSDMTPATRVVDLPLLANAGGDVMLTFPGHANDMVSLNLGLPALAAVAGDVDIALTTFNASVSGLAALTAIPGNFTIGDVADLTVTGLLQQLASVGGDVLITSSSTTTNALPAVQTIAGSLTLEGSVLPPGLSGFYALTSIGGDLELRDGSLLGNLPASHFPVLTTVNGTVDLENVAFTADTLFGAALVNAGAVRLEDNSLTTLATNHLHVAATGDITITNNANLCTSAAQAYVAAQTVLGWSGSAAISGNMACR